MHCEKCGSADTEIVKCSECGQKSRLHCANCGFSSCIDKYCSVISIKRKIKLLTYLAGGLLLFMLGTLPVVVYTYRQKGFSTGSDSPTPSAAATKRPPTKRPPTKKPPTKKPPTKKPPTKKPPTKRPPTKRPPTKRPPTKRPPTERPPTKKPSTAVTRAPGQFASFEEFQKAIADAIARGKGIKYKKGGKTRQGMDHRYYIKWTYAQIHWDIPDKIKTLINKGKKIKRLKDLKPGDIMFFSLKKNGRANYMALYKGNGKLACVLPKKGIMRWGCTRVDHKFFKPRFLYARRYWPKPKF